MTAWWLRLDKKAFLNGYVIPTGRSNEGFLSLFPKIKQVQVVKLTLLKLLPLALCVNKFSHINIVDFFITRSITSNKFVLSSLNQEIRLLAIFNCAGLFLKLP